ncbi:MAG: 2-amino-4-hydroxy-6-hydroxymethyldihydropteridine diphosphokinase [Alphaproteobacteria bacterium]
MIIIALGANLPGPYGPPKRSLQMAIGLMAAAGVDVKRVSSLYATPPYPPSSQPYFVNAAISVAWAGEPLDLLELLHAVEAALGRRRRRRWAARTIDLDLIDFEGQLIGAGPQIVHDRIQRPFCLPHPQCHKRDFVLGPIAEIAAKWRHPVYGQTARALWPKPFPRRIGRLSAATKLPEPLMQRFLDIHASSG